MEQVAFSAVTALRPRREAGAFDADVHPEWTIGGKPNGGYLLAMLTRAATTVGEHPDVIAASAHYLRPPDPGPAVVEAEVLRGGRAASQLRARLRQDGRSCIEALVTTSRLDAGTTPYWANGVPDPGPGRYEDAIRLTGESPSGLRVAIMDQIDLRLDRESLGFGRGRPAGRGELRGWLELGPDETFDSHALVYAVDSFPPATFDIETTGWVPTLELTAYVRARPAPGPVRVLQKAHLIDAQRVDEVCWVWDGTGRLVAHGTQLAAIRLGDPAP